MDAPLGHVRLLRHAGIVLALALACSVVGAIPASPVADDAWHLDDGFGQEGEVVTSFGGGFDEIFDVALQKDGKIVAVGEATLAGQSTSRFAIARYNPNGNLDQSFGGAGTG